jgi:hypothetical protein
MECQLSEVAGASSLQFAFDGNPEPRWWALGKLLAYLNSIRTSPHLFPVVFIHNQRVGRALANILYVSIFNRLFISSYLLPESLKSDPEVVFIIPGSNTSTNTCQNGRIQRGEANGFAYPMVSLFTNQLPTLLRESSESESCFESLHCHCLRSPEAQLRSVLLTI